MMDEPSDGELLRRHAAGEGRAFDILVDRYERRVYAVALRMCGDPEDARDVTQEVFISALRSLRSFRGEAQLSTWFHRVTVNASLDRLRKRARHDADTIDEASGHPAAGAGPEERAIGAVRAEAIRRAIAALSDDHRAVVVLHDLEGLDYGEIARTLDVPVGTVKSRIHRARVELAKRLGHLRESADPEPAGDVRPLRERG